MKKVVGVVLTCALLLVGTSTFADSISLIGKKVQGTYKVTKDGVNLVDAIIIDGVSYVPLRSVAESTGLNVNVKGKTIVMTSGNSERPLNPILIPPSPLGDTKEIIEAKIAHIEYNIKDLEQVVIEFESAAKTLANNSTLGEQAQKNADRYKAVIEQRKIELQELKEQLAKLQ